MLVKPLKEPPGARNPAHPVDWHQLRALGGAMPAGGRGVGCIGCERRRVCHLKLAFRSSHARPIDHPAAPRPPRDRSMP